MKLSINATQVQATNDASIVSKLSTVKSGYFDDKFLEHFVQKPHKRAPLIHLGYYTRLIIIERLIQKFIEGIGDDKTFQIISCGAGFDSLYWRLTEKGVLSRGRLIEVDFNDVIQRKLSIISTSDALNKLVSCPADWVHKKNHVKISNNYTLINCDLSNISLLNEVLRETELAFDLPTLFLSECAVTYMNRNESDDLFQWISSHFVNSAVINYEQVHPCSGFGQIMMAHFQSLQSPLLSVDHYATESDHSNRYKTLGFHSSCGIGEWDLYKIILPEKTLNDAFSKEQFDEFEELHSKCTHYVIGLSGQGALHSWWKPIRSLISSGVSIKKILNCRVVQTKLKIYGHTSFQQDSNIFLLGGIGSIGRLNDIKKLKKTGDGTYDIVNYPGDTIPWNFVHGSATSFKLNDKAFFTCFGGRTSPKSIWMNGSFVIAALEDFSIIKYHSNTVPKPRYRSSLAILSQTDKSVIFCLFGGRESDLSVKLSDFWIITLNVKDGDLSLTSEEVERKPVWPSSRMSHSLTCADGCIYLSCGLDSSSYDALGDLWMWNQNSATWLELIPNLCHITPRYGHTSHILSSKKLYLIGGTSSNSGPLPEVAVVCLQSLIVQEYFLEVPLCEPILFFNHTSELVKDDEIHIFGGGGNCFSFGTHINTNVLAIPLNQLVN